MQIFRAVAGSARNPCPMHWPAPVASLDRLHTPAAQGTTALPSASVATGGVHTSKINMQETPVQHYRGYAVHPSAHRLPDGSFSANLLLARSDSTRSDTQYRFYSLDYFAKEVEAIHYSRQWARGWIDTKG
ncbi:MAG: hypothetical protein CBARDMAM_6030 [uncultured Caballeronia sp.]|nr:MAG: hypothetical protein CBARDMAM_6030 [uncultured Caballeronia sp.]